MVQLSTAISFFVITSFSAAFRPTNGGAGGVGPENIGLHYTLRRIKKGWLFVLRKLFINNTLSIFL